MITTIEKELARLIPAEDIDIVLSHREYIESVMYLVPEHEVTKLLFELHNTYIAGSYAKKEEQVKCHVSRGKIHREFQIFIEIWTQSR